MSKLFVKFLYSATTTKGGTSSTLPTYSTTQEFRFFWGKVWSWSLVYTSHKLSLPSINPFKDLVLNGRHRFTHQLQTNGRYLDEVADKLKRTGKMWEQSRTPNYIAISCTLWINLIGSGARSLNLCDAVSLLLSNCSWLPKYILSFLLTFIFKHILIWWFCSSAGGPSYLFPFFFYLRCPEHPRQKQACPLSPLVLFSGCCAGEPNPLASALHHLWCFCSGGRSLVYTQRHKLATSPDPLPLQCKRYPLLHPRK